jgi:hypothetical protein
MFSLGYIYVYMCECACWCWCVFVCVYDDTQFAIKFHLSIQVNFNE